MEAEFYADYNANIAEDYSTGTGERGKDQKPRTARLSSQGVFPRCIPLERDSCDLEDSAGTLPSFPRRPARLGASVPTSPTPLKNLLRADLGGKDSRMVCLNVYDLTTSPIIAAINHATLKLLAGGAFHIAIEVAGQEWFYGHTSRGSGVTSVSPCEDGTHHFRSSVPLGRTTKSHGAVLQAIEHLGDAPEWQGPCYHDIRHNCCHFARALAAQLGVGPLPSWVDVLCRTAESLIVPLGPLDYDIGIKCESLQKPWRLSCPAASQSADHRRSRKIPSTIQSI